MRAVDPRLLHHARAARTYLIAAAAGIVTRCQLGRRPAMAGSGAIGMRPFGPVRPFGANAVTAWTWPHCAVGAPAQPRPGRLRLQCRRRAEAEAVRPRG
jgi:hypothetical protein